MAKIDFLNKKRASAHGGGVRGDSAIGRSELFQGRFGRIFRSLPAGSWTREALASLAREMTASPEQEGGLPAAAPETDEAIQDDEENTGVPAGYTYFGQFIDHDITFDPASSLQKQNDPDALVDYRTPRLDLDSLYGRGPDDQPYMYDGKKFRLGRALFFGTKESKARDLPRYMPLDPMDDRKKRALIGDKRNDENVIVSQLHAAFLQFHNRLVELSPKETSFEEIQRKVRWHYQWLVVNDFLPRICSADLVNSILRKGDHGCRPQGDEPAFKIYKWRNDAFMPIEFSAAAYRFGHSMVRPIYRLNTELDGGQDENAATPAERDRGLAGRFFIFAGVQKRGLGGFDEFPQNWAIDWSLFFDINGSCAKGGKERVQPAYKIDTSLVNPLGFLPEFSKDPWPAGTELTIPALQSVVVEPVNDPSNLAERNLLRGSTMGLPSGQSVARALGLEPIPDEHLLLGKAVLAESLPGENAQHEKTKPKTILDAHPSFADNAPLWYYVLAEAQYEWLQRAKVDGSRGDQEPVCLGPVGGRIVAETLIGLLWADGHSYLRQAPNWKPGKLTSLGKLIQFALGGEAR